MAKRSTVRTPERSEEEWTDAFEKAFERMHCTMHGRAMPVSQPKERREAAKTYAALVMDTALGKDRSRVSR